MNTHILSFLNAPHCFLHCLIMIMCAWRVVVCVCMEGGGVCECMEGGGGGIQACTHVIPLQAKVGTN